MSGLKVNFTDQEADSKALDFDPIPAGKYYARLTKCEDKECGPESKNPGKPFWALTFTVQDGEFENRKVFSNCMLFAGALYTLSQLMKSTGNEAAIKTGNIPDGQTLISKEVILTVAKVRDRYKEENEGTSPLFKNEVKGISPFTGDSPSAKVGKTSTGKGAGSLLP